MANVKFEIITIDLGITAEDIINKHLKLLNTKMNSDINDKMMNQRIANRKKELKVQNKSTQTSKDDPSTIAKLELCFNSLLNDIITSKSLAEMVKPEIETTSSGLITRLKNYIKSHKNTDTSEYVLNKTAKGYRIIHNQV